MQIKISIVDVDTVECDDSTSEIMLLDGLEVLLPNSEPFIWFVDDEVQGVSVMPEQDEEFISLVLEFLLTYRVTTSSNLSVS